MIDGMRRASIVLPEPGGPIISTLVPACGSHFECPFDLGLTFYVAKIAVERSLGFGKRFVQIDPGRN